MIVYVIIIENLWFFSTVKGKVPLFKPEITKSWYIDKPPER